MTEILIGKLLDLAFTAAFTKLNRDEVAEQARQKARDGATLDDITDWLASMTVQSEDAAQKAIDEAEG